jgi:hypothetical protein
MKVLESSKKYLTDPGFWIAGLVLVALAAPLAIKALRRFAPAVAEKLPTA